MTMFAAGVPGNRMDREIFPMPVLPADPQTLPQ